MKKLLIMVLICAFAIPVMANPFSDVPFSHWAYSAVSKLASKGLISGFPDGSFKGQKVMTRYELAMVVAKLLSKVEKNKVGKSDEATIDKLVVEFSDELALLGVKVTALEDEVAVVKDDIAMLKDNMRSGKSINNGKIRFSGWMEMRYENNTYQKSSTKGIYSPGQIKAVGIAPTAADNFNGIIGSRTVAARTTENATNLRTQVQIFMDADIDENVSLHVQLRNGLTNSNYNIWGTAQHSADDEWATDVYESYIKVEDFFGWADVIKFGRQYYGISQGLTFESSFNDHASVCNMECSGNTSQGYDGITVYKRFNDVTSMDLYSFRTDTDEDTGLNVIGLSFNFELEKNLNLKAYYTVRNDNNIFDPSMQADYSDVTYAVNAVNANWTANHENPTKVQYYGLGVNGDITRDLVYYGEFAVMDHIDSVLDPNDANWLDTINPQKAFMIGLKWQAKKDLALTLEFRSFDEFYRPITAGAGLYGGGYIDNDVIGDLEFDNLGYTSDFRDMFIKLNYSLSNKTDVILTYESIDDTTSISGNNGKDDDENVWTLGFSYKYKANTKLNIYWKQFDVENVSAGATGSNLPIRFVDNNANGTYEMGVDNLNMHDPAQEDHSQLRCEVQINF